MLEELGFNWQLSPDFIVVTKQTLREPSKGWILNDGRLSEAAVSILVLAPVERGVVAAALERVQADLKDWVSSHLQRKEPINDVVVHYSLPGDRATTHLINGNFTNTVLEAVGPQRSELITPPAEEWIRSVCRWESELIIKRYEVGNEQRLGIPSKDTNWIDLASRPPFPPAFLPIFPNGWTNVAEREGFELPEEPQKK